MSFLDLSTVKMPSNEPLQDGTYMVQVESAEVKETKSKDGKYINLWFKVIDGEDKGRKVSAMFNIENKSTQAEEIGQQQLKSLLISAGRTTPESQKLNSVNDLVGLKVAIATGLKKNNQGKEWPQVKKIMSPDAVKPKEQSAGF